MTELPSFHDGCLVSYEVNCEERRINLRIRRSCSGVDLEPVTVELGEVQGYHFENDAFGNIIFSLEEVPVAEIILRYGDLIRKGYNESGAPGAWANDLVSAKHTLAADGVRGIVISSSYGLSGWVLAKRVVVSSSSSER